jgi:hypothetical protein
MASPNNTIDSDDLILIFVVIGCLYAVAALGSFCFFLFWAKRRRRTRTYEKDIRTIDFYSTVASSEKRHRRNKSFVHQSSSSSLLTPIETISAHVSSGGGGINNFSRTAAGTAEVRRSSSLSNSYDGRQASAGFIDRHRSADEIAVLNVEAMNCYDVPKFSGTMRWHSTRV